MFVNKMYIFKYFNKMGIDLNGDNFIAVGFEVPKTKEIAVAWFTPAEFATVAADNSHFDKISRANAAFRTDRLGQKPSAVKVKKALRLDFGNKELNLKSLEDAGWIEKNRLTFSVEDWKAALKKAKAVKNQANRGYAFEILMYNHFGQEWDEKKKGVDLILEDGTTIELKFRNGQVTL